MILNVSQCPVRPLAIICDYRLRGEENGIDVIRLIQSEYNQNLPAMLITGDTAADRLIEANAADFFSFISQCPTENSELR